MKPRLSEEKLCAFNKRKCQSYEWSFCDRLTLSKTVFKSTFKNFTVGKKGNALTNGK